MKTLIIDDNEIDRLNLRTLLEDHRSIELAGEADTLDTAVALIGRERPAALFLDIHLGRQTGFGVLEKIGYNPLVVITTSHPHYAIQGFEADAVDYLLKPVLEETLARAVNRLLLRAGQPAPQEAARLAPDDVQFFKDHDGLHVVPVAQILAITGERIYTKVLVQDGRELLHNRPIREWKELLPEKTFLALDRSTLVNLREIQSISADYTLAFRNSRHTLALGETAMKALRKMA